ncbi:MAG: hypothetical protein OXG44_10715 [Gammaproteobacteria bacterium]|nr:hypothetical protein [Gammaproteobacteria bacterium]
MATSSAERMRALRQRRRYDGRCVDCATPSDMYRCVECRRESNRRVREHRGRLS